MPEPKDERCNHDGGGAPSRRQRLVFLARNAVSFVGFFLVGIGLLLLSTFAIFVLVSSSINPYFGIVGYMILPGVFISGLAIVPIGMLIKQRRLRRQARAAQQPIAFPAVDLNDPKTRAWVGLFLSFSFFIVLPVLGVSSYYGYQYTESVEFCGQVCHAVMEPEATAHAHSPHARVSCAGCHIGPGASWFVKSKITGFGQVIAVMRSSYPRPIPPAITELRPARITCEQCHWPAQFFGYQFKQFVHFGSDEHNTRRAVRMMLKVGGGERLTEEGASGIHVKMLLSGPIRYVATDRDLQDIPWVEHTGLDGTVEVYRSDGKPAEAPPPSGTPRTIDCMDCHNRGAHHFRSPQVAVDACLDDNRIDRTLPYVQREAVAALLGTYADAATADAQIDQRLAHFYREQYPEIWKVRSAAVVQAGAAVGKIYRENFFPAMKVTWRTYLENVGHMYSPGCFRCHDGLHVNQRGRAITSRCDACHVFQNPVENHPEATEPGPFHHSMDLVLHLKLRCSECHTGGTAPDCRDCHALGEWLPLRGKTEFRHEGG